MIAQNRFRQGQYYWVNVIGTPIQSRHILYIMCLTRAERDSYLINMAQQVDMRENTTGNETKGNIRKPCHIFLIFPISDLIILWSAQTTEVRVKTHQQQIKYLTEVTKTSMSKSIKS